MESSRVESAVVMSRERTKESERSGEERGVGQEREREDE
jgi:hypothetical protein